MSDLKGFWSYVNADDHAVQGRIRHLANDLKEEYQLISGDTVDLFLDKDSLNWGDRWRNEISSHLTQTAFFIPVLTPRYFYRPECLNEINFIIRKVAELKLQNIILPLLYIDVPALHEASPNNNLITLLKDIHYEDWREARLFDVSSEEYRRRVSHLASRLFKANRQTEKSTVSVPPTITEGSEAAADESPGIIDKLVTLEETFPKIIDTLQSITNDIKLIGQLAQKAAIDTKRADSLGKGFAPRFLVVRSLANDLNLPTERVISFSNEYSSQLHDIDAGYRVLIDQAPAEALRGSESKKSICGFFDTVRALSKSATDQSASFLTLIETSKTLDKISRELRPAGRRLRRGLAILVESTSVIDEWVRLIDSTGIEREAECS